MKKSELKNKYTLGPSSNKLTMEIQDYMQQHLTGEEFDIKQNRDHIVVKHNNVCVTQVYSSKVSVFLTIRKEAYTEEEKMVLDDAKTLTKTRVLNLKFKIHSLDEFIQVLNRSIEFTNKLQTQKQEKKLKKQTK